MTKSVERRRERKGKEKVEVASKAVLVQGNDWAGLYIDGKCVFQNHEIRPSEIHTYLSRHKIRSGDMNIVYGEETWLERMERSGRFPDLLSEVVMASEE